MVKQGYKQTEIGIIPDEWDLIAFEDCFSVLPNNTLSRAELNYNDGELQNIHYGDILVKLSAVTDCSAERLPYVNAELVKKSSKGFLRDGDIIIADTAEDDTVGKTTEVVSIKGKKVVSGLHTIPCRPKDDKMFAPMWLGYFVNHNTYHDQLLPYITGTKVSAISKSAIAGTMIAVPKTDEQKEIVKALSDIDALITNLEKLIAKKKAIKQGAMQELLTGKRRLLGFEGEWINIPIKQIGTVITGSTPSRQNANYWGGSFPWISAQDFSGRYIYKSVETITDEGMKTCRLLPKGSVLVTCIASIGRNAIAEVECATNQQINAVVCHEGFHNELLYYVMCYSTDRMIQLAGQTAVPIISKAQFEDFVINIPRDIREQSAIASVLGDMDDEIYKYEELLSKYRDIKNGMMSELLTGNIRLIDKEDA